MSDPRSSVEFRLQRVERAITELSAEIAAIRAALRLPETTAKTTPPPPPEVGRPQELTPRRRLPLGSRTVTAQDLERLVGSYGMLAIAVLAAVAAVGTFLSWAIAQGFVTIGPSVRVVIGLAFAAAIGIWGTRLRRRERSSVPACSASRS